MAKNKFCLGILVMALVFGMAVAGCDNNTTSGSGGNGTTNESGGGGGAGGGSNGGGTTTRSITITGIPAAFHGDLAMIVLVEGSFNIVAQGIGLISGNSITFVLMNPANTANWTGSGSFHIMLEFESYIQENQFMYTRGQDWAALGINNNSTIDQMMAAWPRRDILATQTIAFNQFRLSF